MSFLVFVYPFFSLVSFPPSLPLLRTKRQQYEGIPPQLAWMGEMLEYNTKGGKLNRGMGVVDVLRAFAAAEGRELRHEEVRRSPVRGVGGGPRCTGALARDWGFSCVLGQRKDW